MSQGQDITEVMFIFTDCARSVTKGYPVFSGLGTALSLMLLLLSVTMTPRRNPPKISLKSRIRDPLAADDVPGPGQYVIKNTIGQGLRFSMTYRAKSQDTSDLPGPGAYDHHSSFGPKSARRATTIKGRIDNHSYATASPGPVYLVPSTIGQGPKFTMSPRIDHDATSSTKWCPGPATYLPKGKNFQEARNGKTFGTKNIISAPNHEVPGPGAYNPSDKISKPTPPKFSLTPRTEIKDARDEVPGPGAYDGTKKWMGPSMSVASRLPEHVAADFVPAPNTYNPTNNRVGTQGPYYSLTPRTADPNLFNDVPGPGAYDLPDGQENRPFSFKGRHEPPTDNSKMPGPTAYYPIPPPNGPHYTMSPRLNYVN